MSSIVYAIPERKLYDEKADPAMKGFVSNIGIDFSKPSASSYPTIQKIKLALIKANLQIELEQNKNFWGEKGWCCGIKGFEENYTAINVDNIIEIDEPIKEIISFPTGNWTIIIRFLKALTIECGNILFLCDTGQMSLITTEKEIEEIVSELK